MSALRLRALLALVLLAAASGTQAQNCQVDFGTLDFGVELLGEFGLRTLTVINGGATSLPLDVPGQPCPEVPAFTVSPSGHFDVASGASRVFQVRFAPTQAGGHECLLDLGTNDCPPVALRGWGLAYTPPAPGQIGLYLDLQAQICQGPLDGPNQLAQVRVPAVLPEGVESITAAEFRIAGLPTSGFPPNGMWSATWSSSLVIGDPVGGMAIAWSTPQPGPIVEIGYFIFVTNQQGNWIGPDHQLSVVPWTTLAVVDAEGAYDIAVGGGDFTFNCSDPPSCVCYVPTPPLCVLQPSSLDFGVVNVGAGAQQSFTIWNQGEGVLTGIVSEDCPDFSILSGVGPFGLESGESRTVTVRFAPASAGPQTCVIDLGTADCPEMVCSGTGYAPEPICQVTPASLDFGDLAVGNAANLSFTIKNIGAGLLVGIVSEDCPDFWITAGAGPFSLSTNQTRTVTVRFAPSAPGPQTCAIALGTEYCNDVPCTGFAHEPVYGCQLVPPALDFGDIALGTSWMLSASLNNTGDLTLTGTVSLDDLQFALTAGGGPYSLPPGSSRTITVRYTPLDYGPHAAAVSTGNATCGELPLAGRAHEPVPVCVLSPPALDFGEVMLGDYTNGSFSVGNLGDGPLVGDITLVSEHFHLIGGGGPFTLQPGNWRQVTVRFDPQAYGPLTATVLLGSAACADLPLSGFGRNPSVGSDHLGLYLDSAGTDCAGDFPVGLPDTLYVIATVPSFASPGITGAEFRVDGIAALAVHAEINEEWFYPPESGNLVYGLRFAFGAPVPGEQVLLGRLTVMALAPLGENVVLTAARSLDGEQLRVNDAAGLGWDVGGGRCTLNCTNPQLCDCLDFESGACQLSDTELDFGTAPYGSSVYRDLDITNVGFVAFAGDLQISGPYFSLTQGAGPFLLEPGETHHAQARFHPGSAGVFEGLITTGLADCPEIPCHGVGTGGGGSPFMGLYADYYASVCFMDQEPYEIATVKVSVLLPEWLPAITAAEFAIENLPYSGADGQVNAYWNTNLVIGDPHTGIALAFQPALSGPIAQLGELDFYEINDDWIGDHYIMQVTESASGHLVVVGTDYVEYWCNAGHFTFNCWGWCDCTWATPVLLSNFALEDLGGAARVNWSCESGGDAEFRLEGERDGLSWQVAWQRTAPGQYEAEDHAAALAIAGELHYRLFGRLPGEEWQLLRSESLAVSGRRFTTRLAAAHPNPFNPSVTVPFSLAAAGRARLAVYDVPGRLVRELLNEQRPAGEHAVVWDGRDESGRAAGTGVYFVRLEAAGLAESQKLVLLR
ncbi:choice-of-anchor D domain-containing protein [bacterium]|nr:choice-of-anchor D domain-containing protein [bacterium]